MKKPKLILMEDGDKNGLGKGMRELSTVKVNSAF